MRSKFGSLGLVGVVMGCLMASSQVASAQDVIVFRPATTTVVASPIAVPVATVPTVVASPVVVARPAVVATPLVTAARVPVALAPVPSTTVVVQRPAQPVAVTTPVVASPVVVARPVVVRSKVFIPGRPVFNFFQAVRP